MNASTNRTGVDIGWVCSLLVFLFLVSLTITVLRYGPAVFDKIACCLCTHLFTPLEKKLLEDLENNPCWTSNPIQPLTGLAPIPIPVRGIRGTRPVIRLDRGEALLSW